MFPTRLIQKQRCAFTIIRIDTDNPQNRDGVGEVIYPEDRIDVKGWRQDLTSQDTYTQIGGVSRFSETFYCLRDPAWEPSTDWRISFDGEEFNVVDIDFPSWDGLQRHIGFRVNRGEA